MSLPSHPVDNSTPADPPATVRDSSAGHPRFTGIRLLTDNVQAWQAKRDLIAQARQTLDLAYFILEIDATTSALMLDIMAAGERGVKVRLLVDYYMTFGQATVLRTLGAMKNVEVRRYRPPSAAWLAALRAAGIDENLFVKGLMTTSGPVLFEALKNNTIFPVSFIPEIKALRADPSESRVEFALRVLATLSGVAEGALAQAPPDDIVARARGVIERVRAKLGLELEVLKGMIEFLRRSHHKLLLADGQRFIMGGRNLGDAYQRGDPPQGRPFVDTDVLACDGLPGGVGHGAVFHSLWEAAVSVDVALPDPLDDRPALDLPSLRALAHEAGSLKPSAGAGGFCDLPDMDGYLVDNLPSDGGDPAITLAYVSLIRDFSARGAPGVIDIVSAYVFLVDDESDSPALFQLRESLLAAARAGVTVNLRTNSVATTDLRPINRAAYPKLIELIDGGVNVFELAEGQGSLHTKAAAIGDEWLIIGSYNFDPRSELYDTNNLIVLHDRHGAATRAFRDSRVVGLTWTQLTPESIRQLADEAKAKSATFNLVRRLL